MVVQSSIPASLIVNMLLLTGVDIFSTPAALVVVTTNACVKQNGALVMGAGAALEAARLHPSIPWQAGRVVKDNMDKKGFYGFLVVRDGFGIFQVKYHYKEKASADLIARSADMLAEYASKLNDIVVMNYPGIGFGGLSEAVVAPLLANLPDNVVVCKR